MRRRGSRFRGGTLHLDGWVKPTEHRLVADRDQAARKCLTPALLRRIAGGQLGRYIAQSQSIIEAP